MQPGGWGQGGQQQYGPPLYPPGIQISPAAGPWDVAKQFLINLFQYKFVEVLSLFLFMSILALVIGYIGDEWPDLFKWIAARAGRLIERRAGAE